VTFQSFAEDWRRHRMHDPSTVSQVEANFRNHVYPAGRTDRTPKGGVAIGHLPLRVLAKRPSLMQAWIKSLPVAASTAQLIIGYVGQVLDAAAADKLIVANPLDAPSIQLPDKVKVPATPWSAEQVVAVASLMPAHLTAAPLIAAATGMRQGETLALAADDIQFLHRSLHVEVQLKIVDGVYYFNPLKNSRTCPSRDVPMDDEPLMLMAEFMRQHPPVPVTLPWGAPDGKPVTRNLVFSYRRKQVYRGSFNWAWRRAWAKAGVPDRGRRNGFHVTRHTAASAWLSSGLNPAAVAKYLGDTLQVVIDNYSHFMPEDDDRARQAIGQFLGTQQIGDEGRLRRLLGGFEACQPPLMTPDDTATQSDETVTFGLRGV
jgi:integrase